MTKSSTSTRLIRIMKQQRLAVLVGLCLGSLLYLGKYLSDLGSHGDHMAQVWGPSLSIVGILSGVWMGVLQLSQQKKIAREPAADELAHKKEKQPITALHVVVALVIGAAAFFLPILFNRVAFDNWQQDNILSQLHIEDASSMKDGSTAKIYLPETKHSTLAITLTLDSLIQTGSCVAPAKLSITPTHNGNDEAPLPPFQSGAEQTIKMHKNTPTQLLVKLDISEEPSCKVKLNVTKAYYHK